MRSSVTVSRGYSSRRGGGGGAAHSFVHSVTISPYAPAQTQYIISVYRVSYCNSGNFHSRFFSIFNFHWFLILVFCTGT